MNRVLLFMLMVIGHSAFSFEYPNVTIKFLKQPPTQVYFGETVRIPVQVQFSNLQKQLIWLLPKGSQLQKVSGYCPAIPKDYGQFWAGTCTMNLLIPGKQLGQKINGFMRYYVAGEQGRFPHHYAWNFIFPSPKIDLRVTPHCPSMQLIPLQKATANQDVIFNLRPYVAYYDEQVQSGVVPELVVTPAQNGLRYDPKRLSIVGKANHLGLSVFTIAAKTARCVAQSTDLRVEVKANPVDKPYFKNAPSVAAALTNQHYKMNLLDLIEPHKGFMTDNQVHFRIKPDAYNAPWLSISSYDATLLEGFTPEYNDGQITQVTLIASSNTGGDSEPFTLIIPIAYDPLKKPTIQPFKLAYKVGEAFDFDVTKFVTNPSNQPFELLIDKIEPEAPWFSHNKTSLHGLVPLDAAGSLYKLTMRVSTSEGGASYPQLIPLQIDINKEKTPYFKLESIRLPIAVPGMPYLYDFTEHGDAEPEDIPYHIELAADYANPGWVEIENNRLVIKEVPELDESAVTLYLTISNVPGGRSAVAQLNLLILPSHTEDEKKG